VTRHVDVRVVALLGLVFDVRDRDGDTARLLFGRLVDLVERRVLGEALIGERLRDRCGQGRLAVVDVSHRSDVDVGLCALELTLRHFCISPV
jgi:hypothetical protein